MADTLVSYHSDGPYETARPAINVKVHVPGAAYWPDCFEVHPYPHRPLAKEIVGGGSATVDAAYQRVASDFWQAAQEIAEQRGLGEIAQEGRSGGWLVFTDGRDPQDSETFGFSEEGEPGEEPWTKQEDNAIREWLDNYRAMREWAESWIADAPRRVRDLAQQYAMDDLGAGPALRFFAFDQVP